MRKIGKKVLVAIVVGLMALANVGMVSADSGGSYTCDPHSLRVKSGGSAEVNSPAECAQPKEDREVGEVVPQLINVVLAVLGIAAVLVIIIGGIMYATSAGDAARVNRAKNIILYAVIGLIVSLLAWGIVNFVLAGVFGGTN